MSNKLTKKRVIYLKPSLAELHLIYDLFFYLLYSWSCLILTSSHIFAIFLVYPGRIHAFSLFTFCRNFFFIEFTYLLIWKHWIYTTVHKAHDSAVHRLCTSQHEERQATEAYWLVMRLSLPLSSIYISPALSVFLLFLHSLFCVSYPMQLRPTG